MKTCIMYHITTRIRDYYFRKFLSANDMRGKTFYIDKYLKWSDIASPYVQHFFFD